MMDSFCEISVEKTKRACYVYIWHHVYSKQRETSAKDILATTTWKITNELWVSMFGAQAKEQSILDKLTQQANHSYHYSVNDIICIEYPYLLHKNDMYALKSDTCNQGIHAKILIGATTENKIFADSRLSAFVAVFAHDSWED